MMDLIISATSKNWPAPDPPAIEEITMTVGAA